jgi:hypothetical protein
MRRRGQPVGGVERQVECDGRLHEFPAQRVQAIHLGSSEAALLEYNVSLVANHRQDRDHLDGRDDPRQVFERDAISLPRLVDQSGEDSGRRLRLPAHPKSRVQV